MDISVKLRIEALLEKQQKGIPLDPADKALLSYWKKTSNGISAKEAKELRSYQRNRK